MNTEIDRGVKIHWRRRGPDSVSPVMLLHSLGADSGMWQPQVETLTGRTSVVTVDTRGHGRSSAPEGPYTIESLCADILTVADHAGFDRFHVVGLSLGGQMALWLAAHHPERLLTMTAANTGAKIGTEESWTGRIDAVRSKGMAGIRTSVVERWFSDDFAGRHPTWFGAACEVFESTDPAGYIACCEALAAADLRAEVSGIGVPSLIVGSDGDLSTPPEHARWLAAQIPSARLEIIEGARHLSNLDRREAFDSALVDFLGLV